MVRKLLAVFAGYAVMAILVMLGFSMVWFAPEQAFVSRESLEVKSGFVYYTLVMSFVAAMIGGYVCGKIGRNKTCVPVLAGVVLVAGLAMAVNSTRKEKPHFSPDQLAAMSIQEKAEHGRQPDWYSFAMPVLGAVGVLIGGRRRNVEFAS